jgi:S-adenosylmethionine decarboxylase
VAETVFEEKRFEAAWSGKSPELRKRGLPFWDSIVAKAGVKIISMITTEACDAYLLSESSLIVYPSRVILLTSGGGPLTGPALALLGAVGTESLSRFIYERRPAKLDPRALAFGDEVAELARLLPAVPGVEQRPDGTWSALFDRGGLAGAFTLEVSMAGIDRDVRALFRVGPEADTSSIHGLLPDFDCDEHFFEPDGYSLNALKGEDYFTVHVTPDARATFETTFRPKAGMAAVVSRVTSLFMPEEYTVCAFEGRRPIGAPVTTVAGSR